MLPSFCAEHSHAILGMEIKSLIKETTSNSFSLTTTVQSKCVFIYPSTDLLLQIVHVSTVHVYFMNIIKASRRHIIQLHLPQQADKLLKLQYPRRNYTIHVNYIICRCGLYFSNDTILERCF